MNTEKKKKLENAGWQIGNADDFLGLSPEESAYIDLKLALSHELRRRREQSEMTQAVLARRIGSSQSRIAKAEAGDPGISLDLLVRALIACGWGGFSHEPVPVGASPSGGPL